MNHKKGTTWEPMGRAIGKPFMLKVNRCRLKRFNNVWGAPVIEPMSPFSKGFYAGRVAVSFL